MFSVGLPFVYKVLGCWEVFTVRDFILKYLKCRLRQSKSRECNFFFLNIRAALLSTELLGTNVQVLNYLEYMLFMMSLLFSIISFASNVLVFMVRDLWLCAKYFLQRSLTKQIL